MHTRARREVFRRNQWSQSVDTRRTPLSLHYLILMCHLKNIKQSFVTENAGAREFHYECKHDVLKFLLRQPATAKWNRNAIVLAVKRSVLRPLPAMRIIWLSHQAPESQQVCLCTYLRASNISCSLTCHETIKALVTSDLSTRLAQSISRWHFA